MPVNSHLFKLRGVTNGYLAGQMPPPYGATVIGAAPPSYLAIDVQPSDAALVDAQAAMDAAGYDYVSAGGLPAAKTIREILSSNLTSDGSAILVASGYQDTGLTVSITTKGAALGVVVSCLLGVVIGGDVRAVINGGSYPANTVIGPASAAAPVIATAAFAGFTVPFAIDATANDTTYTIKVQARGVGVLSSVTPRAGSALTIFQYD